MPFSATKLDMMFQLVESRVLVPGFTLVLHLPLGERGLPIYF
jgi:hypothetical protein